MESGNQGRFSDEQAKAILARAIELDARAPTTTADELRAIAADIGVSPSALEAALREQAAALRERRRVGSRRAATAVAALGLPLGAAAGALLTLGWPTGGLAALGLMAVGLIASGALVVVQGAAGTLRSFHLRNLVLWGGVAAGSFVSLALLGEDVRTGVLIAAGWCMRSWVASSILGSAGVIAVRRARRPEGSGPDGELAEGSAVAEGGRWKRIVSRVIGWIARPLGRRVTYPPFAAAS